MIRRIEEFCRKEKLLEPGMGVVVGVSGGADSVCLLRMLCLLRDSWRLRLAAVHVHHGIRGAEAEEDLHYAEKLCREWDVELLTFRIDVPGMAKKERLSLEEAGRNVRYRIFESVRERKGCERIAVAHHMDDQAETVLMNLARGSGIRGMAATRPIRGTVIRPLLCVRRREIENWLCCQGIAWRTDSTNLEEDYLRNRIRGQLIPTLESCCNERAVEHIAGMAADLQEADDFFRRKAAELLALSRREQGRDIPDIRGEIYRMLMPPAVELSLPLLAGQPHLLAAYAVREGLAELGCGLKDISRVHVESILELAQNRGGREIRLPHQVRARLEYDRILLEKTDLSDKAVRFGVTFDIFFHNPGKKVPQNCCINWFDYDKINRSIRLRSRRPGDRICVAAGKTHKKLKEYLIDAKMPARVRDRWPVLAMDNRILWIPGYRMDEEYKVDQKTRLILQAEIHREQ